MGELQEQRRQSNEYPQVEQNTYKMSDNDLASYKSQINTGSNTILFRGAFASRNTLSNKRNEKK